MVIMKSRPKFFLSTFGCRCNQADSSEMRAQLRADDLEETQNPRNADLIVINSCTVTGRADRQVRQAIRRCHRENPDARLVVTGCYAERNPEALAEIPGVTCVLGNADRGRLSGVWRLEPDGEERIFHSPLDTEREDVMTGAAHLGSKTRPFLKIQDGCDACCSYCIVPSVRGPERSAPPDEIVAAIERLVEQNYHEIVLTGVHLASYGRGLDERPKLKEILRRVLEIPGLGRLRLSSIELIKFDLGIIELAVEHRNFAPHFHIPLQSGSDRILKLMRRPYRAARFVELLEEIRSRIPHVGLGTDVLVGFPGETDQDFEDTRKAVEKAQLSYIHVFPFSAREGTDAYSMPGKVPPKMIKERCEILRRLSQARNLEFRKKFVGTVLPAITLDREEGMGRSVALTENFIHARIAEREVEPNQLVEIRIEEADGGETRASLASKCQE
jgi:threonylcarbamoyladenosine tRNA methylthiotransferase MtaB